KDNPLLHMWSLGVEEQFYLVWPIVIAWCVRVKNVQQARARLVITLAGLTAGSFALCLFITWKAQPWAFFGTPTRAWEFGLGALVMLLGQRTERCTATTLRAVGALGLLGVVAGAAWLDDTLLFPGAWALLPAGGTALILMALHSGTRGLLWRGLTLPPLVRAGDVSYSWYLWHWPLLVMARALWPEMSALAVAGAIVVSYVAAEISWRWVEQPIRAGWAARLAPRITVGAAATATAAAAAGLTVGLTHLRNSPGNELQRVFAHAAKDNPIVYRMGCHVPIRATQPQSCELGDVRAQRTILLFGDSHAAQWVPALDEAARQHNWRLLSMTKSGCPWVDTPIRLGQLRREYVECDAWRKAALDRIGALRPDVIVLANSHHRTYVAPSAWSDGAGKSLAHLAATTPHIVVLSDTVWPGFDVPRCLARAEQRGADLSKACRFDVPSRLQAVRSIHDAEQQAVALAGASWVDPVPSVCPSDPCPVYESGVVHFSDQSHMTASFSRSLSADIWPAIDSELSSVVQAASTPPHLAGGHPPAAADSAGKPLR
ncbi:MAG: acyltransferase, partial [Rubrivivax sp.]|nr:acyltransferase [Rubrivivax sp.]